MKTRGRTKWKSAVFFTISVLLIFGFAYLGFFGVTDIFGTGYEVRTFDDTIKKGLDLKGGVSVTEEIVSNKKVDKDTIDRTIKLLTTRVNKLGVSETSVVKEGPNKIKIDVPGAKDTENVLNEVSKAGKLEFKDPDGKVILEGKDVKNAIAIPDSNGTPEISLTLTESGRKKFATATARLLHQEISIYIDDNLQQSPKVEAVINDGKASITSKNDSLKEMKYKADMIKSGALPVTLKNVSANVVGATLGENALPDSEKAGIIGIAIVMLFMALYYRVPGLIADIALLLFVLLVLYTYSLIDATLSLSGIAGFLLTVGMAVDANVLIFERTKEELKSGKSVKTAIDEGFKRAFSSILDSNMTTVIAGIILYNLGSGSVKGFALTLIIGVLLSMFTAVVVTRQLIRWAADMGWFKNPAAIGTFGVHDMRRGGK